jgi:hypothetical protein
MNPDCERALLEMDTLADPEWLQGHLAGCATCRAEAALRERVRVGLQRAVRATPVDARMESRVRVAMAPPAFRSRWQPYAAAAALLMAVGSYWAVPWAQNRLNERAYFDALPAGVSRLMRVGLFDHVHCAAFRKWPKQGTEQALPAAFRPVLTHIPANYRVVSAHECKARGRSFVHLVMRDAKDGLVSLVIARKQDGETFSNSPLRRVAGGGTVFHEDVPRFQIAGFEADAFLVFVVSEMDAAANQQLAVTVAGPVTALLNTIG